MGGGGAPEEAPEHNAMIIRGFRCAGRPCHPTPGFPKVKNTITLVSDVDARSVSVASYRLGVIVSADLLSFRSRHESIFQEKRRKDSGCPQNH